MKNPADIAAAIRESAEIVFRQKGLSRVDRAPGVSEEAHALAQAAVAKYWAELAREISNNAAQGVLCALEDA